MTDEKRWSGLWSEPENDDSVYGEKLMEGDTIYLSTTSIGCLRKKDTDMSYAGMRTEKKRICSLWCFRRTVTKEWLNKEYKEGDSNE